MRLTILNTLEAQVTMLVNIPEVGAPTPFGMGGKGLPSWFVPSDSFYLRHCSRVNPSVVPSLVAVLKGQGDV
jgi:hypothetical protein